MPARQRSPATSRSRGLTLVELLVTLLLVSLLGTLLVQSVSFFAARYEAVQRVARQAARADMQQRWFAASVRGLVPEGVPARRFEGGPATFKGTTLAPLEAPSGLPVVVQWRIAAAANGNSAVGYAEAGGPHRRVLARPQPLAFQYADAARAWHNRWPPASTAEARRSARAADDVAAEWIPSQVRLVAGQQVVWLASVDATPIPRVTQDQLR